MKVFNCLHPKVITNPYTGEKITVKCGKCEACKNAKVTDWVIRLDMEASCHKYTLFTTLTYDDLEVPQVLRLRYEDFPSSLPAYIDSSTGELINPSDIKETFTENDKQYIRETKVLNVLQKSDFQKFIKRLRYYFDQCDKGSSLRYFLCAEYGPTTYRGHGHLLLFFDSEKCASEISTLLSKSWKHGNIYDPHFISGSASEYCAAYNLCSTSLPKIYLHKSIRPFHLFSKSPAIGTLYPNLTKVREIFEGEQFTFTRYDSATRTFKDEYLPRSLKSRLFPRLPRFGSLLPSDRVILYREIEKYHTFLSSVDIAKRIKAEYIDRPTDSFLSRYYREISYKKHAGYRLVKDTSSVKDYSDLPFLPAFAIELPHYAVKSEVKEFCFNSLVRFVRTLKRVQCQSQIFGVSIEYYAKKISSFYENYDKYKLKEDYRFQEEYFKSHPSSSFKFFDIQFLNRINNTDFGCLSSFDRQRCTDYGLVPDGTHRISVPLESSNDYLNFSLLHRKINHDLVKQKKNNDYVLRHRSKFSNVFNYQKV